MSVARDVALHKASHPDLYCPKPGCLWRTDGGYCPRHATRLERLRDEFFQMLARAEAEARQAGSDARLEAIKKAWRAAEKAFDVLEEEQGRI